jgi:pilus assembly protein Flp/PilA
MSVALLSFWCDERGATAIEYGILLFGIALAIISVVTGLGSGLNSTFGSVSSALGGSTGSTCQVNPYETVPC